MRDEKDQTKWLVLAIASGASAALNGAFAKLTTDSLTTSWARYIASRLALNSGEAKLEYLIRAAMFGLNTIFNGIMWGVFTQALSLSTSAIRVNVINTASNFLVTAVLGALLFSENLPALWFVGAALLLTGGIIIGASQDEDQKKSSTTESQKKEL